MTGGDLRARLVDDRAGFSLDVDLEIAAGQTLALVGPNGAGKTTIIDLLAGVRSLPAATADAARGRPTGSIRLGETVLDDPAAGVFVPPEHRRIGVVHQQHLLFDHLTVVDNVAFGPRSRGVRRRDAERAALDLLERLDLATLADRRPQELSGGQAQRVAIARALATQPEVLLLDEPLSALDVETRVEVRRLVRERLGAFEGPAIFVGHDPADALLLGDRVAVVEDGHISQIGSPDDVRTRPATRYVAAFAGTNLIRGVADGGRVRVDADGGGHELRIAEATISGPVLCAIRPEAVSLHPEQPIGSQRNVWATVVDVVEPTGDTTRVTVGAPLPLAVDVTPGAVDQLGIVPGRQLWVAVKATEISVRPG